MKTVKVVIALLLISMAIAACSIIPVEPTAAEIEQTSMAVQIPEELELALSTFLAGLLSIAFVWVFEKINLDLRGFATPLAFVIGGYVVTELQNYINTVPEMYDPWIDMLFKILLVIFVPVGALRLWNGKRAQPLWAKDGQSLIPGR